MAIRLRSPRLRHSLPAGKSGTCLKSRKDPQQGPAMIRKVSCDGIGYSVVELNDVRHVYAAAVPRNGDTLEEQAHDALRTIEAVIQEEGTKGSIVHQAVFMADAGQTDQCRRIMKDFYGPELPATTYVPQHPCEGKLLSIEALGVGRGFGEVQIERRSERVVITRHNDVSWIHCAQVVPQTAANGIYDRSIDGFEQMQRFLADQDVRFDQVIRTWLYLGDIVGPEGKTQRYKELNRARTDYYEPFHFATGLVAPSSNGTVFPASTGIGTDSRDVLMSCIALATTRKDIVGTPLENPRQVSAFDYSRKYGQKSPKFARAMALSCGPNATIFISGTASITDSETQHVGDPEAQTRETLDNIEALISEENLARHGMPGLGATLDGLALVRVYIKRQEDYTKVRAVCEQRLGELPTIYAVADVCRPDLLVEIEGVAFSERAKS
jgi:enamine deaminase RidA (YjgF/YER057c/UK114 family)